MKKNDFILIIVILVFAGTFWFVHTKFFQEDGAYVTVSVSGEEIGQYELDTDIEVDIQGANDGTNHLVIKDGIADITEASCPDGLCVDQKSISKDGESIICLPNEVVVEVHSEEEQELDAIAN